MSTAHKMILDFITNYMMEHDYPPTVREIAAGVGYASTSTVFCHLQNMRNMHLIDYNSDSQRTIRVPGYHYKKGEGRMEHGRKDNKRSGRGAIA